MMRIYCHECHATRTAPPPVSRDSMSCPSCRSDFVEELSPSPSSPSAFPTSPNDAQPRSPPTPQFTTIGNGHAQTFPNQQQQQQQQQQHQQRQQQQQQQFQEFDVDYEHSNAQPLPSASSPLQNMFASLFGGSRLTAAQPASSSNPFYVANGDPFASLMSSFVTGFTNLSNRFGPRPPNPFMAGTGGGLSLDAVISHIMNTDNNRFGTPPASQRAIDALPKIKCCDVNPKQPKHCNSTATGAGACDAGNASEDAIGERAMDGKCEAVECSVCMDAFSSEDKDGIAIRMPCKHVFHQECLMPWLKDHNSCPSCRMELETDNADYEDRKRRARQQQNVQRQIHANGAPSYFS
eukprot:ANDGO_05759.mRNA.1 E3 ubiquitin-protein ligase RING1-like